VHKYKWRIILHYMYAYTPRAAIFGTVMLSLSTKPKLILKNIRTQQTYVCRRVWQTLDVSLLGIQCFANALLGVLEPIWDLKQACHWFGFSVSQTGSVKSDWLVSLEFTYELVPHPPTHLLYMFLTHCNLIWRQAAGVAMARLK